MNGIVDFPILETPVAILDFETTGLTPGQDRVVEVSVVRLDPGKAPRLVLDTLVNPKRRMAATEIHGITDADVRHAPEFQEIAGELVAAMSGCVMAAYNVYFDLSFLSYELGQTGVRDCPPHFCIMYLRPMLGLGGRCKLEQACREHNIGFELSHIAARDAECSANLLAHYFGAVKDQDIRTYGDLSKRKKYKFTNSFSNNPLPSPEQFDLRRTTNFRSRAGLLPEQEAPVTENPVQSYWDTLSVAIADMQINEDELDHVVRERERLGLTADQIRFLHARVFECAIAQFVDDQLLNAAESQQLQHLHRALSRLGWAPGE